MIHDCALMIHYEKYDQPVHIHVQMCKSFVIINSVACYMFRPPIVAIFRDVILEVYVA
jgi:hypothetical protein